MPSSQSPWWGGGDPRSIAHGVAGGLVAADATRLSVFQFTAGSYGCEFYFEVAAPTTATLGGYRYGTAVTLVSPVQAIFTSASTTNTVTSGTTLFGGLFASGGVLAGADATLSVGTSSNSPWIGLWVDAGRCVTIWLQTANRALAIQSRVREYKFGGGAAWIRYA